MIPSFRAAQKLPLFEVATGEEQGQSSLPAQGPLNWVTPMLGYFRSCQLRLSAHVWNKQAVQKAMLKCVLDLSLCRSVCKHVVNAVSAWLTSKAASFSRPWAVTTFLAFASTVICVQSESSYFNPHMPNRTRSGTRNGLQSAHGARFLQISSTAAKKLDYYYYRCKHA